MKHKFTYYAVLEERGTCGLQDARLVSGDGKCEKGNGFDTLRAARQFVHEFVADRGRQATNRDVQWKEVAPNEFKVTWEYQNERGRWEICYRHFKIEERTFALFTAGEVATRFVQSY